MKSTLSKLISAALLLTALLSATMLLSYLRVAFGWTNPGGNPPSGSGSITVDAIGNVGIKTPTPTSALTVATGRLQVTGNTAPLSDDSYPPGVEIGFNTGGGGELESVHRKSAGPIHKTMDYKASIHNFLAKAAGQFYTFLTVHSRGVSILNGRLQASGYGQPPLAGTGVELGHDGTTGVISSIERPSNDYKDLQYEAENHKFQTNGTEQVQINSSGNVGIGTSNPGQKLEVSGRTRIRGASPGSIDIFVAVGDSTSRTGGQLCNLNNQGAQCLAHWNSAGGNSGCTGLPTINGRALCAVFGD